MAGVKKLALTHHDPDHDDGFLLRMERLCQERFPNACWPAKEWRYRSGKQPEAANSPAVMQKSQRHAFLKVASSAALPSCASDPVVHGHASETLVRRANGLSARRWRRNLQAAGFP